MPDRHFPVNISCSLLAPSPPPASPCFLISVDILTHPFSPCCYPCTRDLFSLLLPLSIVFVTRILIRSPKIHSGTSARSGTYERGREAREIDADMISEESHMHSLPRHCRVTFLLCLYGVAHQARFAVTAMVLLWDTRV